jgi:general secretion pathway protein A
MDYFSILNLNKEPFSNSPDPDYFFHSQQHVGCLQKLELSLRLRRGLNVVIGEVGTGKTTLCRQLIRKLSADNDIETHLILDPDFSTPNEFLLTVTEMLTGERPADDTDDFKLKEIIKQVLFRKGVDQGRTVVLIIDEGQKVPVFCLELLREFLNFETNEYKLLQIAIFAQTEFNNTLKTHANFADRINMLHLLAPMNFQDTKGMIQFRLNQSSAPQRISLFTGPALWAIFRASKGYPRKIVNLCHRSILTMIIQNKTKANWFIVRSCIKRVFDAKPGRAWQYALLCLLVLVGLTISVPKWLPQFQKPPIAGEPRPQTVSESAFKTAIPDVSTPTMTPELGLGLGSRSPTLKTNPEIQVAAVDPALSLQSQSNTTEVSPLVNMPETIGSDDVATPNAGLPGVLGQLRIQKNETLGGLIQKIYGVFNASYLRSVVRINPHISDPNTIKIGEVILFPAIPAALVPPPLKQWWVEIGNMDDIETAFTIMRNYSKSADPPLLVPYWNRTSGLHFSILLGQHFYDQKLALNRLDSLSADLKINARVISEWEERTVFFASPYQGITRAAN